MSTSKYFAPIFLFTLLSPFFALADTTTQSQVAPYTAKGILIVSIDIKNAKIVSQDGNILNILFTAIK
jgi:hypothetical protein